MPRPFWTLKNDLTGAREWIGRLLGRRRMLIVDEAQYLDQKHKRTGEKGAGFEWLRAAAETGGFDLVLCGDLTLANIVQDIPQLQSRMRRPVIIPASTESDVRAVAGGTGYEGPDAIRALHAIAMMKGGLRNVENVLRVALAFAGAEPPNLMHLRATITDMRLVPKGGF